MAVTDSDHYELDHDREANVLRYSFHGVWDAAIAARWERTLRHAVSRCPKGFAVLVDVRTYPLQPPEVSAVHEAMSRHVVANGARGAVFLVSETIMQMRIRRMVRVGEGELGLTRFTTDPDEAFRMAADLAAGLAVRD